MKRLLYTFLTLILILTLSNVSKLIAEDFIVLSYQGNVKVRKNNKGSYLKIKTGDKLNSADRVKLSDGAYLGLIHKLTNRTKEINKDGTYKISSLSKEMSKKKKGFNERFAGYVLDEIGGEEDMFATGAGDDMSKLGSVERAIGGEDSEDEVENLTGADSRVSSMVTSVADELTAEDNSIRIKLPRSTYLVDDEVELSWYPRDGVSTYEVKIVNPLDKVMFSKKTHSTSVVVNLKDTDIRKGATYYWYVTDGSKESSTQYALYWMTEQDMQPVNNSLSTLDMDDMTSLDRLMLAQYYEDQNMMLKALDEYKMVMNMSPGVDDFKKVYARYLNRIGLYTEAKSILGTSKEN